MKTIHDYASVCGNRINITGTLTEFYMDKYESDDYVGVNYKGVINCDNAFITIKGNINSYDSLFKEFVNDFGIDAVGKKVFALGKLNSLNGINISYISPTHPITKDSFIGMITGVPYTDNKFLIIDNEYHQLLNIEHSHPINDIWEVNLKLNPLVVDENSVINNEGVPPIIPYNISNHLADIPQEIIDQALEEHEIYLEAIRDGR